MKYDKSITEVLDEQYDALTEDLDGEARLERGSHAWVMEKVLTQEKGYLNDLLEASGTTADIVPFTTIALPLVRKIFSNLIAMDLVSIQPIAQPTAKVFFLDFVYGATGGGAIKGQSIYGFKRTGYATRSNVGSQQECTGQDGEGECGTVRDLQLKLSSTDITAIEKALKAAWSIEEQQDLRAYHGLNIETEIMTILQQEIVREIDGLILASLLACASAGNVNWNTAGYLAGDTTTTYRRDYRKTLYEAIVDADNLIFKTRYRYATWIVGHPDAIVRLEKLEDFKTTPYGADRASADKFTIGRHLVGTLAGRYKVYKDPFWSDSTKLLLGYKGATWSDTVGFYAPYIPLYTTPLIVDPDDFNPRRGLLSRFAYGCLISDGMSTVTLTTS